MHIFVPWSKAFLDVSGVLLIAKNCNDIEGCWYFEAKVTRVKGSFESV
jgi:hypothetical protein